MTYVAPGTWELRRVHVVGMLNDQATYGYSQGPFCRPSGLYIPVL